MTGKIPSLNKFLFRAVPYLQFSMVEVEHKFTHDHLRSGKHLVDDNACLGTEWRDVLKHTATHEGTLSGRHKHTTSEVDPLLLETLTGRHKHTPSEVDPLLLETLTMFHKT